MVSKNRLFQRMMALLLCAAMLLPMVTAPVNAVETGTDTRSTGAEPLAVVWSGSDFQFSASGNTYEQNAAQNKELLLEIITAMKNDGIATVDEALFPGDLTPNSGKDASDIGAQTVLETLNEAWHLSADDVMFATGNHDSGGFDLNDATGGYDREHYSVYNINHNDFPVNASGEKVDKTAAALDAWLDAKAEAGYTKSIFVMAHLPLHHNFRSDNVNAGYLVDVLNEAGSKGLNIIFLFGHNHSGAYDRYLGGSCIYYAPGDTMLVTEKGGTKADFQETTLNFTYMNAGYVGYVSTGEDGVTLSACSFEIYEDRVEITRYNKDGKVNLKNVGKHTSTNDPKNENGEYLWNADTTVTTSSQTLYLGDIVLDVDEVNTTLGTLMEKGESAVAAIRVSAASDYTVTWENFNENVVTVEGNGNTANVTAVGNGIATIQAKVTPNTQNGISGAPTAIRFDVMVTSNEIAAEPVDFLVNDGTLYKWTYIISSTAKAGMEIIFADNTNKGNKTTPNIVLGSGNALGATETGVVSGTIEVFEFSVPGVAGYYISNTDPALVWTLEGTGSACWLKNQATGTYLSVGELIATSVYELTLTQDKTHSWYFSSDNTYPIRSNGTGAYPNNYSVFYDGNGSFCAKPRESSQRVHYYLKDTDLDRIAAHMDQNSGTIRCGQPGKLAPGGNVVVNKYMNDGSISTLERVPVTLDMLDVTMEQLLTPGVYTCTVTHMGEVISNSYQLTVTGEQMDFAILSDSCAVYLTDNQLTMPLGSVGSIPTGDEIVLYTLNADGTVGMKRTPVMLDMLDVTIEQLLTPGVHTCTITYQDNVISRNYQLTITGEPKVFMSLSDTRAVYLTDNSASVPVGTGGSVPTGDELVFYTLNAGGTLTEEKRIPITVGMLSATSAQLNKAGTYSGLSVAYEELLIPDAYTLDVYANKINDYPEFPDEGAVKIDKWADTSIYDYFGTGTAQVNLSVTGIPSRNKANAVIIVDASSSMRACIHGAHYDNSKAWTEEQRQSLYSFLVEDINRTLTEEEKALFTQLYNKRNNPSDNDTKSYEIRMGIRAMDTDPKYNYKYYVNRWLTYTGYCTTTGKWAGMEDHHCPTRERILEDSMIKMMEDFAAEDEYGYVPDVDIAIAYFNTYTQIDNNYLVKDSGSHYAANPTDGGETFLEFTNSSQINEEVLNQVRNNYRTAGGTNYDDAMQQAYDLLKNKQMADYQEYLDSGDTEPYEPRQDFVIFMSDGQPYQFNYFGGNTGNWSKWFNGQMDEALTAGQTYADAGFVEEEYLDVFEAYYHPDGKMWMAEAIKGDETQKYKIIDPEVDTDKHITYVNGLGATMLTVGFNLGADGGHHEIMKRIATNNGYYTPCETAEDIEAAFGAFATMVRSANNAVFKDQMGPEFDLQMKTTMIDGDGKTITLNPGPMIQLKLYETWKHSDQEDDPTIPNSKIGTHKSEVPEILESIVFSGDGTRAYSTHVDVDGDGTMGAVLNSDGTCTIQDEGDNILRDGVICARNFWYNTNLSESREIVVNGVNVMLEAETFYWNVGAITEDELVLSYFVYLTGSMEGERNEAGNYETNEYATLTYTNYLGNPCEQSASTPVLPWEQATVGYAFYLVDQYGNPIINQTTGKTGSFEQAIRITDPVYETFALNDEAADIFANIVAKSKLPDGYRLFDDDTAYKVQLDSTGKGYYEITITKKDAAGNLIESTYVVGVENSAITGNGRVNTDAFKTANTVVWFAVYADVNCVPDTVVIDYGLPVDVNVLLNDTMMGDNGTLAYIGRTDVFQAEYETSRQTDPDLKLWEYLQGIVTASPKFTSRKLTREAGELSFGDAEIYNSEVRYSIGTMEMEKEETFVYAVNYTGNIGTQGYYYSTVTVIPATTIYYEDSFVAYKTYQYISDPEHKQGEAGNRTTKAEEVASQWIPVGDTIDAVQAEDRPGAFSLSVIDANNIYGYDQAYHGMTEYSLDSAMKFTASAIPNTESGMEGTLTKTYGTAQFTFKGTGFDIISATSNLTGTITVDIYEGETADDNQWYDFYVVDTYYGYKWAQVDSDNDGKLDDYAWVVDEDASDCLYQVPVIKVKDLPYGTYTAVITVSYAEGFDHAQYAENKYDFYLDAIRIYDPANDGKDNQVIEDAYVADDEGWPEYFELRNLIISRNTFDSLNKNDTINGIVFIDGNATLENGDASQVDPVTGKTPAISDYANFGPNNELYLAPGQAIAFTLDVPGDVASIQMAMKSVGNVDGNGVKNGTAYVKVYDARDNMAELKATTLNTATDLYYDISNLNGKTVVIVNTGAANDAIVSITNIKVTYNSYHEDSLENTYLSINKEAAEAAVLSMRPTGGKPFPGAPEEEHFQPEQFQVKVSKSEVEPGEEITVQVTTSGEVSRITVNGTAVTRFTANRRTGVRTWKYTLVAEGNGTFLVEVVAYNDSGDASEPITEELEIRKTGTETAPETGSWIKDIWKLIFGMFGNWN